MSREGDALAVRLYRRALVLLPRGFRRLHGPALVGMLADEHAMRTRRRRLAGALAFLVLAGCEGDPEGRQPTSGPIEVPPTDLHVVGTAESVAGVEDLAVLPDGTVWVLTSVEPFFVGFAPQGGILTAHGHAGGGPEEFGAPSGFVVGGLDGEAWAFDRQRH